VPERARELAGLCLSLRDSRAILAWSSGQWLACSTLKRWVHTAAELAAALRGAPLEQMPAVVLLDGVWVKLLVPTGERDRDRQGRERERYRGQTVPLLLAYGVDPVRGERWLLDWEQGEKEDQASWQRLLERLQARGLSAAAGLSLFVHDGSSGLEAAFGPVDFGPGVRRQRCIFHVLRTVGKEVQGERGMTREQRQARRRDVSQDAAAIWEPLDRGAVRERYRTFCTHWRAQEPKAVAALERAFELTLAYLDVRGWAREQGEDWAVRYLRTTSALERVNRALRQKARQVGAFHAERGLTAAIVLVAVHRGLTQPEPPTDLWTEVLEAGLVAA
jgi:transposase-like protein